MNHSDRKKWQNAHVPKISSKVAFWHSKWQNSAFQDIDLKLCTLIHWQVFFYLSYVFVVFGKRKKLFQKRITNNFPIFLNIFIKSKNWNSSLTHSESFVWNQLVPSLNLTRLNLNLISWRLALNCTLTLLFLPKSTEPDVTLTSFTADLWGCRKLRWLGYKKKSSRKGHTKLTGGICFHFWAIQW